MTDAIGLGATVGVTGDGGWEPLLQLELLVIGSAWTFEFKEVGDGMGEVLAVPLATAAAAAAASVELIPSKSNLVSPPGAGLTSAELSAQLNCGSWLVGLELEHPSE